MKTNQPPASNGTSPQPALPNLKSFAAIICHLLIVALTFAGAARASAVNLIWDAGNTNNGGLIDPGSGEWNLDTTTNLNWNNTTNNVSWTQTSTTAGINGAIFNGPDATNGTYNITLDGGQMAVSNLVVNANGYTFSGASGNSIFQNTGTTLTVADGKSVTFSNNFFFPNNNSSKIWQLGTGPTPATMIVNGNIGGEQLIFNSTNGSTFYLGGNTACSVTTIDANVWQTNGTSTGANTWQVGRSVTGSFNNLTGVFVLDGASTIENFNTSLQISRGGGNGTVIVQNGATMNVGTGSAAQNIQIESELANNSHGTFKVLGGTVNVGAVGSSSAIGMIWLNKGGSDPGSTAVYTQSGGTVNAWGGILIGASSGTFTGGTAAFTNSGGFLYIGSGGSIGISRGAVFAPTNYFVLSGGTVGALANWISSVPITLDTLNGNITFQCADAFNDSFNISLSGALTGNGGLYKTGPGTLQLSGANNYLGSTVISNGTLKIVTTLAPANGPVTLDGSAGSPVNTVSIASAGQFWTINGDLTYAAGTPVADFNYGTFAPSTGVAPMQVSGNVNFTVQPQLTVEGSAIPNGTYPLIKYGGAVSGTLPFPTSLPASTSGFIINDTTNKTISLVVTSSPVTVYLTWRVGSGIWDINTTSNWTQFGAAVKYTEPNAVVFDDTASGPFPITVTLNTTVQPTAVTALTANTYTISGTGAIAGTGSLTKTGQGTLTLSGTNSYSGGTTIVAGQLNINYGGDGTNGFSAIGTGPLTNQLGAKIDNTSGQAVTLLTPIQQYWNDDWTYVGSANFGTGPGTVNLGSSVVTLTVLANTLEVDGQITDNGGNFKLFKAGAGNLTLRTDNSFSGGLEIAAGVLNLDSPNCAGSGIFTIDGGAIDNTTGADLTLGNVASILIPIASGGTFTFLGTGNLDFSTAPINPNNGTQMFWNIVRNTLSTEGDISSGNTTITKIGAGRLVIGGQGSASQFTGIINEGEVDLNRDFSYAVGNGGQGLLVQSNAIVRLTGGSGNQIFDGNYVQTRLNDGGILDLNGQTETLDMLSITNGVLQNSAIGATATLTIQTNVNSTLAGILTLTGSCQFDVPDTNAELDVAGPLYITGPGSLVKTGAGKLNLMLTNAYGGDTTVSNGTLTINFPTLTNTSTITLVGTNSILNLNFPNGETNTVSALVINGVTKPVGIYSATTDPASIMGSGSLQVTPAINPQPGPLQFSLSGGNLSLNWPTNQGWILQSQTNGVGLGIVPGSNAWFDVPGSAGVTSTNIPVTSTNPAVFFRLHHP